MHTMQRKSILKMPIYKKRNNIRCTLIIYMYVHAIDCCYDDCADFKSLKMG